MSDETGDVEGPVSVEDVPPREAVKLLMGDGPVPAILLFLKRKRGAATWAELFEAIDHPSENVHAAVRRLQRVHAVAEPKKGMFRLTHSPVGQNLRDVQRETMKKARESRGLAPTALPAEE